MVYGGKKKRPKPSRKEVVFEKSVHLTIMKEKKMIFEGLSRFCGLKTEKKQENIKIRQESIIISKKLRLPLQLEKV